MVYHHDGEYARIDGDNMIKPIQDAMNGLIHEDVGCLIEADRPLLGGQ